MISDGSLPKKEHILKTKDFTEIYKKGRSFRRDFCILYCRPNGLGHRRIGFSISSRNIKRATRRNRIRRVFREVYRNGRAGLANGIDMVFVVRKDPGKEFGYEDYKRSFDLMTKGLGITG